MKIMSLNCQGLGRPEAVQEVQSLIQLHRPLVAFLSETRVFSNNVENLRRSLGFPNGIGVGSFGRGGGLALLWMHDVCVKDAWRGEFWWWILLRMLSCGVSLASKEKHGESIGIEVGNLWSS